MRALGLLLGACALPAARAVGLWLRARALPGARVVGLGLGVCALMAAQGLSPAKLGAPPTDTWPTYNGDYSGRRYSTLAKINQSNINSLGLAWVYRANGAPG